MIERLRLRTSRVIALGGVVALLGAGCAGGETEAAGEAPNNEATTAQDSEDNPTSARAKGESLDGEPVDVGLALALSSARGELVYQSVIDTAEAWASWVNDEGGLAGHPVEIVVRDTEADAAVAQRVTQELVEEEQVDALIYMDGNTEGAIGEYLTTNDVPVIGGEGYNTELWSAAPNFFSVHTTIPGTIAGLALAASAADAENASAIFCSESAACTQAEPLIQSQFESAGLTYSGSLTAAVEAPNYTTECLTAMEGNVDIISVLLIPAAAQRIAADCVAQGYDGYFGQTASGFEISAYESVEGANVAVSLHGFPWWADAPPVQQFRDVLAEYAPDANYRSGSVTNTWATLELLHAALEGHGAGPIDRSAVFDAYHSLDGETLDGLLPQPVTYTEGEPAPKVHCSWLFTFTGGDEAPTSMQAGESGNGAEGELASSCPEWLTTD